MSGGPVMIVAGGTGGHVFPGLAVAAALRERGRSVVWLGTRRGLEARLVPQHGIDIEWITISGLRGKGARAWLAMPFRAAFAVAQSLRALRRRRPSAVLGMGGFVSGPGGMAAWLARRPLLIHEQNAVAGTTNRALARLAQRVYEAFPGSFPPAAAAECVGNPLRAAIAGLSPAAERIAELVPVPAAGGAEPAAPLRRARLLVLGGSQGARALNDVLPAALAALPAERRPEIRHQAGAGHEAARAAYEAAGVEARVEAFVDDMAGAYGWADLVVARAGALTVSEIAAAGLPAVLVPYPYAIDDHQSLNAAQLASADAAVMIAERELDAARLSAELDAMLGEPQRLAEMADAARRLARPDAAERLADACVKLAEEAR